MIADAGSDGVYLAYAVYLFVPVLISVDMVGQLMRLHHGIRRCAK